MTTRRPHGSRPGRVARRGGADQLGDDATSSRRHARCPSRGRESGPARPPTQPAPADPRHRRRGRRARHAGAAAHAGGFLPLPHDNTSWDNDPWVVRLTVALPDGTACHASYTVVPVEQGAAAHNADEWHEAWKVAVDDVKQVDAASLLDPAVLARYRQAAQAAYERQQAIDPPDEVAPPETEAEMRINAPGAELMRQVRSALESHGLPTGMVQVAVGDDCSQDIR